MIKNLLRKNVFLLLVFCAFALNAQTYTFSSGLEGWSSAYGSADPVSHSTTEGVNGDGALVLTRVNNNSNFGLNPAGIDASTKKFIKIRFKNETNGTQLRVQGAQPADNSDLKIPNTIFNITPNSSEYVTMYLDMSAVTNWDNTIDNFDVLIRANYADGEGNFYLDEIEFQNSAPAKTYSEFILNPSFDGPTGVSHLSGNVTFATRSITSTVFHDGTQSLKKEYTANPDKPFWTFTSYEKKYTTKFPANSDIQIKMWVKSNRTTPYSVSSRVKTTDGGVDTATKPIASVTTTNTSGDWEELTFDLKNVEEFDGILFWFALDHIDGAATNLVAGDIVYFDQMTATITAATANLESNILQGVSVYPNPANDILNIKSPINSEISLFNILGAKVKSAKNNSDILQLSVSDLPRGVYMLKIFSENKSKTTKVVIK
ncbi:T9SS type A sorting domain-containing protein [Polaribacter sp. Z022]|uniref:T9SS type A sorting domain-containing protein n=1 Tax=Polaribacter sp. Z022 TaxID=2927125 RepID=UPI0020204CF1|nr:T9SS type A sorting domain-containing protein [Polaribacter sp. Z022]MCL7754584.1 T9SS type A sorting domain-containing protein [Polaribacter sp. Z022]